ncbi:MAG: PQQ-binding-like beta-propeller repeat protein, partial [Candidatus Coatesbacteria bacterium]|nr:PQQ-binding-like beta-propeller repeat protein [Candidatus Coatesbacteria bacterium]
MKRYNTCVIITILLAVICGTAGAQTLKWGFDTAAEEEAARVVESSPCLIDANGDGRQEVFIGSGGGRVYALYSNGQEWWSYDTGAEIFSTPAVADVTGDRSPEVIVGSDDGGIYVFRSSGGLLSSSWPVYTGGPVRASAIIADLDDNGVDDIIISSGDGKLYALDYRGYDLPGFPYDLGSPSESSPAAGDIDNDGFLEIIVGDDSGFVHAVNHDGTPLGGWEMPKSTGYSVKSSPALGDIDTDGFLEIVVGSEDFKIYAWKPNGLLMSGWPVSTGYNIFYSSPALADVDGDSAVEVLIASGDGKVYALEADGRPVAGYPLSPESTGETGLASIHGSVTIADLGMGPAVIYGAEDGLLYAWNASTGTLLSGFPFTGMGGVAIRSTPAVGDLDGDGAADIVSGSNAGAVFCVGMGAGSYNPDANPWPMFLNNPSHVTLFGHGQVPEITMDPIEGEQTGDVTISYELSDRQNDLIDLQVLYSEDSGGTWHFASTSGKTTGLGVSDYRGSVVWHSRDDMDHIEETAVKVKLIPEDKTGMGLGIESGLIHLDNNDPPRVVLEPLEGEQSGDVYINYRLEDDEDDDLLLSCFYSIDGGATWVEALGVEGNLHHIDPAHYADQLVWDSMVDLEEAHIEECLFAIVPEDRDPGQRTPSAPFVLDNNPPPTMFVENITGEQAGDIEINYEVADTGDDEISLACFYSPNFGKDWYEATVEGQTSGIRMTEMAAFDWVATGQLVWLSGADLPSVDRPEVQFRIIPSDRDEGEEDDTVPFRVDNNEPPVARVTDITEEVTGEVQLTFSIDDTEDDTCDILLEYSIDGGASWNPATAKESVEPVEKNLVRGFSSTDVGHTVTWLSRVDSDELDTEQAMLRLTARDNDLSESAATTVAFHLDNNETPTLVVDNITEESSGDIPVSFTLDDRENDILAIACEFSDDGGAGFQPATVTG